MWFEQKITKDAKTRESPNLFAAFATLVFLPLRQFCGFAALGSLRFFCGQFFFVMFSCGPSIWLRWPPRYGIALLFAHGLAGQLQKHRAGLEARNQALL
jgi:hypothetical protein